MVYAGPLRSAVSDLTGAGLPEGCETPLVGAGNQTCHL